MAATLSLKPQTKAGLQEIFSSIQGEGPWVGKRQVFVRFNACHLQCAYCDTPQRPAAEACQIETIPGAGYNTHLTNPLTAQQVAEPVLRLATHSKHHSISLTGGEPLLYTAFLQELLPLLAESNLPIYLETSGTQPEALQTVWPWIDLIAMDIKLPSTTGEAMQLANHKAFYQLSCQKPMFIKLVFGNHTTVDELDCVRQIVTDTAIPIVLQPMMDLHTGQNTVSPTHILDCEAYLSQYFEDVRVIPQTHKLLNIL